MGKVIFESPSVCGDFGILYLTQNDPCNLPFLFKIYYKDMDGVQQMYNISETDIVEFTIKQHPQNITPVIKKRYNGIKNNVAVLSLSAADMKLLTAPEYCLSARLLFNSGNLIRILIKNLQIFVQEVV